MGTQLFWRRAPVAVAAVGGAAAYGWWLVGLEPFAWPSTLAVSVPAAAMIAVAVHRRPAPVPVSEWCRQVVRTVRRAFRRAGSEERRRARAAVLWGVLVAGLAAVQLFAYFVGSGARRDFPTLSWILGHIDSREGRTALFVAWVAFGASLVRR